jgi:hypothetical protein
VQRLILVAVIMLVKVAVFTSPAVCQLTAVHLHRQGDTVKVVIGDKPFTTYHFEPTTEKAYLEPLTDAFGVTVTRTFPVGDTIPDAHEHDHNLEPHQRAMYFAHGNVNGYDFWNEEVFMKYYGHGQGSPTFHSRPPFGRMVFRKIEQMRGGSSFGVVRATFDLEGPDQKPFAEETQEYIFRGDMNLRIIDCRFVIKATHGPVKLGDTKEGTFAIRLAPELSAPNGTMVSSVGGEGEAQIWGKRADWVNVDGVVDGHELGIAIFDNPRSLRYPTYWHARGYGLLSANPFGVSDFLNDPHQDGSYTIPAGKSIQLRYRVFIHEGDYKQAHVAEKYSEYTAQR